MADKLMDFFDFKLLRLSCDCFSAGHILDINIDVGDDKQEAFIMFEGGLGIKTGIWNRIKAAITCLRGKSFCPQSDFVLRLDDVGPLIAHLGMALPGARNTASTAVIFQDVRKEDG